LNFTPGVHYETNWLTRVKGASITDGVVTDSWDDLTFAEPVKEKINAIPTLQAAVNDLSGRVDALDTVGIDSLRGQVDSLRGQVNSIDQRTLEQGNALNWLKDETVPQLETYVQQRLQGADTLITSNRSSISNLNSEVVAIKARLDNLGFKGPYYILGSTLNGTDSTDSVRERNLVLGVIGQFGKIVYGYFKNGASLGDGEGSSIKISGVYKKDSNGTYSPVSLPGPAQSIDIQWYSSNTSNYQEIKFSRNSYKQLVLAANYPAKNGNDNLFNRHIYFAYSIDSGSYNLDGISF
jgi:hypothetical protein